MARIGRLPASLLSLLAIASCTKQVNAEARLGELFFENGNQLPTPAIEKRSACGYYGTLTCADGQYCYTDPVNSWALCGWTTPTAAPAATGAAGGGGGSTSYQMYTTTFVETDLQTVTSTYSVPVATAAAGPTCRAALEETQCGSTCCAAGEFCVQGENYCAGTGGGSSGFYTSFYTASPPVRGTTIVGVTVTSTGSVTATKTTPFGTPVPTGGSAIGVGASGGGGLSAGAIAGIVIAVIVGLLLLLLLLLCCCFKGLLDTLLGRNKKRRVEETYIEERHSHRHHGGSVAAAAVPARRTWFGTRPARTEVVEEKKKSRFGGAAGVTAGLVGLAAILGLKRRHDRNDDKSRYTGTGSDYSYSYTYSDTSASKFSF